MMITKFNLKQTRIIYDYCNTVEGVVGTYIDIYLFWDKTERMLKSYSTTNQPLKIY